MKTIFTLSLPPTERWFNAIQSLRFNGGCQDGEYPRIVWNDLLKPAFTDKYSTGSAQTLRQVQFTGGLSVPAPSNQLSPVSLGYVSSTLSNNQLNVSAPGTWIKYVAGQLTCPVRARVQQEAGNNTITTVFGLNVKTYYVDYKPNAPTKNGVSFGASFFVINGFPTEPHGVNINTAPVALGIFQGNSGYNYLDWVYEPVAQSIRVNVQQSTTPKNYVVTVIL